MKIYPITNDIPCDEDGQLDTPCGCPACDDNVQPGHFACEVSLPHLLQAEQVGRVFRAYDDGRWRWFYSRRAIHLADLV